MDIQFHFTNVDSSDALKDHTKRIIDKLTNYFNRLVSVTVRFKVERSEHIVEITINGDGGVFVAEGKSNNMYTSLDVVEKKLQKQIKKHKEKFISH
ncbi:MAG: ribosome-associated translation inhibitor RaiA [Leptospiraceae bacterium]|nr:ribosome-associated translation inhibitor RaiA [Leptospiraceae bacterium]MDW7976102.1 ribosome-associated translation inhibitor RaiA [Leptospiraceae bacterium]